MSGLSDIDVSPRLDVPDRPGARPGNVNTLLEDPRAIAGPETCRSRGLGRFGRFAPGLRHVGQRRVGQRQNARDRHGILDAIRTTFVASMIPASMRSTYAPRPASNPYPPVPLRMRSTTTPPSTPEFSAICRVGASSARLTMGRPYFFSMSTHFDLGPSVTRIASTSARAPCRIFSRAADCTSRCLWGTTHPPTGAGITTLPGFRQTTARTPLHPANPLLSPDGAFLR